MPLNSLKKVVEAKGGGLVSHVLDVQACKLEFSPQAHVGNRISELRRRRREDP